MIKFKTKEEGILKINDLFLKGFSKEDLRRGFGVEVVVREKYNPFTDKVGESKTYKYNGKESPLYSDVWTWRERLVLEMLK